MKELKNIFFAFWVVCLVGACSPKDDLEKPKPAFVFKGSAVCLDSCPPEFFPFINQIGQLDFVKSPGCVIVPDNEQMYEIVGQMAVIGYNPIFLVNDFGFAEKIAKRFSKTTFFSNHKFTENITVAKLNWIKAKYLAGAISTLLVENHHFVYFTTGNVTADVFAQINAFTLGARFIDPLSKVDWIKINLNDDKGKDESFADKLKALKDKNYGLVVLGTNNLKLEAEVVKLHLPFVGYSSDDAKYRMARFYYDYEPLWTKCLQDFVLKRLQDSYDGGVDDYSVGVVGYGKNLAKKKMVLLDSVLTKVDSCQVFEGPIYDRDGNLQVYQGDVLFDDDLRFMNWLVKGVSEKDE